MFKASVLLLKPNPGFVHWTDTEKHTAKKKKSAFVGFNEKIYLFNNISNY